jgi:hypothetical protein
MFFFAQNIAAWLGIPAGAVIAAMIILRRRGMAEWARHKQARAVGRAASGQETYEEP